MFLSAQKIRRSRQNYTRPASVLTLGPWPRGLNTVLTSDQIHETELSTCVNWTFSRFGGIQTRDGLTKTTSTAFSYAPYTIAYIPIGLTYYELVVTETDYKAYYLTGAAGSKAGTLIGTLEGDATIVSHNGYAIMLDGSYAKTWRGLSITGATKANPCVITSTAHNLKNGDSIKINGVVGMTELNGNTYTVAGTTTNTFQLSGVNSSGYTAYTSGGVISHLAIAYDDGTGTNGYQADHTDRTADTTIDLNNGGNTKAGIRFTTQAWDAGYTIHATQVDIYLSKTGSPTGNITAEIYNSSGTLVATGSTYDSSLLTGTAASISFTFTAGALSPSTEYWATVSYSGGDGANYVSVHYNNCGTGGDGKYYDGSWKNDTAKNCLAAVKPGRPPKGAFGVVANTRLFIAGDPDNTSYVHFSNANTCFDWSTADGGGYVGMVDSSANAYPVGAIQTQFITDTQTNVLVFGTAEQPVLCKLTGSSPSSYALLEQFQSIYSTHNTCVSVGNDIWFGSRGGAIALSGVQEFGDLRIFPKSDSIQDRIDDYWADATAFAGYMPITGQYILKLAGHPRCLVCHTKNPYSIQPVGVGYPWTEYLFSRECLTSSTYKWTASASGTNEYYCELAAGGDPSLLDLSYVLLDDYDMANGTMGSLGDHEWDYGDNDTLGYNTVYIRDDSGDPDSSGVVVTTILEPSCFATYANTFYVGGKNGHIYYSDSSVQDDNLHNVRYLLGTKYVEMPFGEMCLNKYNIIMNSDVGGSISMEIYKNRFNTTPTFDKTLAITEGLTVGELDVTVADANFTLDIGRRIDGTINFNCQSFMAMIRDVVPNGHPLFFRCIHFETVKLGAMGG